MANSIKSISKPHRSAWQYLWRSEYIRREVLITLGLVILYRFLQNIPLPGINPEVIRTAIEPGTGLHTIADLISMFSGSSLLGFSILALGLFPYNVVSQILALLIPIVPALQRRFQEDPREARRWFEKWNYYFSVPMAFLVSYNLIKLLNRGGNLFMFEGGGWFSNFIITFTAVLTLTAGSFIAVFIAELISEFGIRGQGNAILIMSGIIGGFAREIGSVLNGSEMTEKIVIYVLFFLLCIICVVYMQQGRRNIRITYPYQSRDLYAIQIGKNIRMPQPTLPLMVSIGTGGLIGSQLLISFGALCVFLVSHIGLSWLNTASSWVISHFGQESLWFGPIIFLSVFAATYFYSDVEFSQQNYSELLKRTGAQVPGIHSGSQTEKYLSAINRRITFAPALVLGILAVVPWIFNMVFNTDLSLLDGGKIILIVGVIRDAFMNIEAEIKLHGYQGTFLMEG